MNQVVEGTITDKESPSNTQVSIRLSRERSGTNQIEVITIQAQMIQFDSMVNLIQMKLVKVSYNMRNMMIHEFPHFGEFQLIEVMNMKMQMIQFESIVNLIQMKLMKMRHTLRKMMIQAFQHFVEFQLM
jgi:predicted HTH domain antitoxin